MYEHYINYVLYCFFNMKPCILMYVPCSLVQFIIQTNKCTTENNHRGINQGCRADDGAHKLVFGPKILVKQLPGEPVHCREEETNCLVLSTRAGHVESSSIGVPEHSNINFQGQFVPQGQTRVE